MKRCAFQFLGEQFTDGGKERQALTYTRCCDLHHFMTCSRKRMPTRHRTQERTAHPKAEPKNSNGEYTRLCMLRKGQFRVDQGHTKVQISVSNEFGFWHLSPLADFAAGCRGTLWVGRSLPLPRPQSLVTRAELEQAGVWGRP